MKFVLLYCLLHLAVILINAQTIDNGLYVNEERNEFVIVKNDTAQFRYYNDDGLVRFIIGEGVLENKRKGKYIVRQSLSLIEKTSVLYRLKRSDDGLSIRVVAQDSLPLFYPYVRVEISRIQDREPHIVALADMYGQLLLDKKQIDYFDKKNTMIYIGDLNFETKREVLLERGYDYLIRPLMPERFPYSISRSNKTKIEIIKLSDDEILIGNKSDLLGKYKRDASIKLKRIKDDYPLSDFPFDEDVKDF